MDEAEAEALVARLHPLVARIARARFGRRAEADEVVQEALARAIERIAQWSGEVPIEHWAARIAVRLCCDRHRTGSRRREVALGTEWAARPADAAEARERVEELLAHLRPADRLVIVLLDLEGRGTAEIAALTGWSRVAIKVRAMRARRTLRHLARRLEDGP
jgi:RNA polymerase sigma-70 factor (ECF subfamily)